MSSSRPSRVVCALAACAALLAFAGCGGGDKLPVAGTATAPAGTEAAVYRSAFKAAAGTFTPAIRAASQEVQAAKTTADKLKGLDALKAAVTKAATDLSVLKPPANVKADHGELVKGFRAFADSVALIRRSLQNHDPAAAQLAGQQIQQSQARINLALTSIQAKLGK